MTLSTLIEMQRTWAICPACDHVFRLGDALVYGKTEPPKTPFDRLRESQERFERVQQRFEQRRRELMKEATERGQRAARRKARRIDPHFTARGVDPQDVKVLFDPVRYVVFDGLRHDEVRAVELLDRPADSKPREAIHASLESAIRKGNFGWKTYHVGDEDGRITVKE